MGIKLQIKERSSVAQYQSNRAIISLSLEKLAPKHFLEFLKIDGLNYLSAIIELTIVNY
jgi:hypothetical protein